MKKILVLLILFVLIVPHDSAAAELQVSTREEQLYTLQALVSYLERTYVAQTSPLSENETRDIIHDGVRWLKNAQDKNGHFAYEYEPYDDSYRADDNIVRQAGALYELGEVVRREGGASLELNETIENAIAYFEELSVEDEFLGVSFRCIVEDSRSDRCKLGATSLALIGILSYVEAYPDKIAVYDDLIQDYVRYIGSAKKLRTGFRNIHIIGSNAQPSAESSFSNGEALLALVRYAAYKDNETLRQVIDDTYTYLQDQPFENALYLWIMAAVKDMHRLWPEEKYVSYADAFTNWRVAQAALRKSTDRNYCAYVEGVASAYSVLEDSYTPEKKAALRAEIDFWNAKNAGLQIDTNDTYRFQLVDGELQLLIMPNSDTAMGGFLTSETVLTQRIDFTQHCVSAYLQTLVDIDGTSI